MPYEINGMSERYGWDYLSRVTELESLRTLVLSNSFNGDDLIDQKVFERAKNPRHLSIDDFSPDMQALRSKSTFKHHETRLVLMIKKRLSARYWAKLEEASSERVRWIGSNRGY